jgi:hypothetical protein
VADISRQTGYIVAELGSAHVRGIGGTDWNTDVQKDRVGAGSLLIAAGQTYVIASVDSQRQTLLLTEPWAGVLPADPESGTCNFTIISPQATLNEPAGDLAPSAEPRTDPAYVETQVTIDDLEDISTPDGSPIYVQSYNTFLDTAAPDGGGGRLCQPKLMVG